MRRATRTAVAALGLCALTRSAPAADVPAGAAQTAPLTPGADQIQFAAREHDLGYRAYVEKQYAEAASHFENAFFAAPNPAELRSAIRARRDAGELARAATLATIGQRRFPVDDATSRVAADTIAQARPHVYEVKLSSSAEYSVAIDAKIVAADRARDSRIFVNPGAHELVVSWSESRSERIAIEATEGGTQSLHLEPPPPVATEITSPPAQPAALPPTTAGAGGAAARPAAKPLGPAVFVTGAAITALGVGLTTWSGIDTWNDPGRATVRSACQGSIPPESCPAYQTGLNHERRTNVLIGVTAGLAAATAVVGLFFTQWSPPGATNARVVFLVGLGQAEVEGTW